MALERFRRFPAAKLAIAVAACCTWQPVLGQDLDYWRPAHASQASSEYNDETRSWNRAADPVHVGFTDAEFSDGTELFHEGPQTVCDSDLASFPITGRLRQTATCETPWWAHRNGFFGEFLWLRPGSSDLIFATEQTSADPAVASPTGPLGITNMGAEGGFRVGFTLAASDCSSLETKFTRWDGSVQRSLQATGGNVLDSNVIHPSTETSGAASLAASADHRMTFQTVDLNYRHLWRANEVVALHWLTGVRYGNMNQRFQSDQEVSVATGLTNVSTDIDFHAFGISGGLDLETFSSTTGLSLYGRTLASLLAGEWRANYEQTNQFGGGRIANRYEDFRATPVLEAELGVRWMAPKRHLLLSTGFLMSAWYETLTTRTYIDAARSGDLIDAGETMTFSGLTARAEWRF